MNARHSILMLAAGAIMLGFTGSVAALVAAECARVTHVSHGGQADHADLGEGRVMWRDWWSQEGSATDFAIVLCDTGEALRLRAQENNMNVRTSFDRTDAVLALIARELTAARAFATLARMAATLEPVARDVRLAMETRETCACAAYYPQLRGDKQAFVLEDL
jgi:hypothetical protein